MWSVAGGAASAGVAGVAGVAGEPPPEGVAGVAGVAGIAGIAEVTSWDGAELVAVVGSVVPVAPGVGGVRRVEGVSTIDGATGAPSTAPAMPIVPNASETTGPDRAFAAARLPRSAPPATATARITPRRRRPRPLGGDELADDALHPSHDDRIGLHPVAPGAQTTQQRGDALVALGYVAGPRRSVAVARDDGVGCVAVEPCSASHA